MKRYRHEYKYIINPRQKSILELKAVGILELDKHALHQGMYTVRSLYFDDYADSCYYENQNGVDPRSKFRVRYYDNNLESISLEKKSKCQGMTLKESCQISVEECSMLIEGKYVKVTENMPATKKKLFLEMQKRMMQPKVIVTYDRIPFVYSAGNVRVTFDQNISASNEIDNFLKLEYRKRPVLDAERSVLEVKWDELLPLHIKEIMQLDTLQWSNFSKYYICRQYNF